MRQHLTDRTSAVAPPRSSNVTPGLVSVVGLGYVGLPLAFRLEERGYRVVGIDTDSEKVRALRSKVAPQLASEEQAQLARSAMRLFQDPEHAYLRRAAIIIVCVPTPVDDAHMPDLGPLTRAIESIGTYLSPGQLVIVESTVNPGVCDEVLLPILESRSGLTVGTDFFFAHCPERINPGDEKWTVATIPRVVGAGDAESLARARTFYESVLDAQVFPMASLKEAEAVKIVENSFRDINIAFVNELAMSFHRLGIDVMRVIEGASTKPFSFIPHTPGCGVGGHCIPVDPYYLISYAEKNGFTHRFLSIAREVNNGMPKFTVDVLEETLVARGIDPRTATVALLGLTYKRDVPDLRESPALVIERDLRARGVTVVTYDPLVPEHASASSLEEALAGADCALIAADHTAFRALTPEDFARHGVSVVIDGKNCLPKDAFLAAGITYRGIGT